MNTAPAYARYRANYRFAEGQLLEPGSRFDCCVELARCFRQLAESRSLSLSLSLSLSFFRFFFSVRYTRNGSISFGEHPFARERIHASANYSRLGKRSL